MIKQKGMDRRGFLKNTTLATGSLLASGAGMEAFSAKPPTRLVVLHTNDVHSRLEPFPMDGSRLAGQGGVASRAQVIQQIRKHNELVLLLDAGDIFQGTPYFNIYKGEPEIKTMSQMGYDACTIGNHDFDAGMDNLAKQFGFANFPMIVSNYDFSGTEMEGKTVPFKIFRKGPLKIGVYGLGIKLSGLVPESLYGKTVYQDPVQKANEVSDYLKKTEKCDFIICLSHLGYKYGESNTISDYLIAKEMQWTDLIIGGHTHTFLDEPTVLKDKNGSDILINQVGWGGVRLGRLDFIFEGIKKKNLLNAHSLVIDEKTTN
ncbi:MAG: metallophosphatase [Chitinophagaceae bacterium]|jgi:5'-nucleotidase|nr:metallophosphatase [Chitinophagaceae bacterium]